MPNIVVVGGGQSGVKMAQALEKHTPSLPVDYKIIMLDRRDHFYHMIAGLRAPLETKVAEDSLIPYDRLFKGSANARVAKAEAKKIDDKFVYTDATGEDAKIEYAHLVLATGCNWADEIDSPLLRADSLQKFASQGQRIAEAKKIVIVGGGAVGIELAAEIAEKYPGQKQKHVVLVHRGAKLMNDVYPDKLRNRLQSQLEALGVEVKLGSSIADGAKAPNVTLSTGEQLTCDLLFLATGGKPNSDLLRELDASAIAENGSVKVNEYFQVAGHPNIFAIGDLADLKEQKQAAKVDLHVSIAAINIVSLAKENKTAKAYPGQKELVVVTTGKKGGAGYIMGFNVGSFISSMIKSKGLFISQSRKMLAY